MPARARAVRPPRGRCRQWPISGVCRHFAAVYRIAAVDRSALFFRDALARMTKDGGQRTATADGAMLADPASLGNLAGGALEPAFEPEFWAARGELIEVTGGRGSAL